MQDTMDFAKQDHPNHNLLTHPLEEEEEEEDDQMPDGIEARPVWNLGVQETVVYELTRGNTMEEEEAEDAAGRHGDTEEEDTRARRKEQGTQMGLRIEVQNYQECRDIPVDIRRKRMDPRPK
jgi:hypothetical protein